MQELTHFLDNQVLFWSLIACLSAQFLKVVFNIFSNGENYE